MPNNTIFEITTVAKLVLAGIGAAFIFIWGVIIRMITKVERHVEKLFERIDKHETRLSTLEGEYKADTRNRREEDR